MNLARIGLRLAVGKVRADDAAAEYQQARSDAEEAFAQARTQMGVKQTEVVLPDGTTFGTISIKAGPTELVVNEQALFAWVEEHTPSEIEEVADQSVLSDPDVLAWLKANRPDAVKRKVRGAWWTAKLNEAADNDGHIIYPVTGEATKVADVIRKPPTGAFQLKPTKDGADRLLAALRSGELADITGNED